ncbi:MAG: hypothetical protein ACTHJR_11225, partial [Sphingomonas sp.]|uniref:hypothetical protein n=1 Tax=Sphingomonas sp. TaxID=28214 RepID=UPI003F7FF41E
VSINKNLLLQWFTDKSVIIPETTARALNDLNKIVAFGGVVQAIHDAKINVLAPTTIENLMNPKDRFTEWLHGDVDPAAYGLDLTEDELKVPEGFRSAKAKFVAAFTPPVPPYLWMPELDPTTLPEHAQKWLNDTSKNGITTYGSDDLAINHNWLRLVKDRTGKVVRIMNENSYGVTVTEFTRLWNDTLREAWRGADPSTRRILVRNVTVRGSGYDMTVYTDRVAIGCQTINRVGIERIVKLLGLSAEPHEQA